MYRILALFAFVFANKLLNHYKNNERTMIETSYEGKDDQLQPLWLYILRLVVSFGARRADLGDFQSF